MGRLSGYTLTLRRNNLFYDDVTLEDVMQIWYFDAELRSVLLNLLEYIEVSFRTHLGYFHSEIHGSLGYNDKDNFNGQVHYNKFIKEIHQFITDNQKNEVFIKHYNKRSLVIFSFWVIVELMSFGCLSRYSFFDNWTLK